MTSARRGTTNAMLTVAFAALLAGPVIAQQTATSIALTQEQVTTVEGIEVSGAVPVPKVGRGAPAYTAPEIEQKHSEGLEAQTAFRRDAETISDCYQRTFNAEPSPEYAEAYERAVKAGQQLATYSTSAEATTQAALQARIDAASGKATTAQVEAAEIARQQAVVRMSLAEQELNEARATIADIQQLLSERTPVTAWRSLLSVQAGRREAIRNDPLSAVPRQYRDLKLEDVRVVQLAATDGQNGVRVTGAIRNPRNRATDIPPVSLTAVDEFGYALKREVGTARGSIPPGQAVPFAFELKPVPSLSRTVLVGFSEVTNSTPAPAATDPVCAGDDSRVFNPANGVRQARPLPSNRTFQGQRAEPVGGANGIRGQMGGRNPGAGGRGGRGG